MNDSIYKMFRAVFNGKDAEGNTIHAGEFYIQVNKNGNWVNLHTYSPYERLLCERKLQELQLSELPDLFEDM